MDKLNKLIDEILDELELSSQERNLNRSDTGLRRMLLRQRIEFIIHSKGVILFIK